VSSKENAANPASWGMLELIACNLHWTGPEFLGHPEAEWPNSILLEIPVEHLTEFRQNPERALLLTNSYEHETTLKRFSS